MKAVMLLAFTGIAMLLSGCSAAPKGQPSVATMLGLIRTTAHTTGKLSNALKKPAEELDQLLNGDDLEESDRPVGF